MWLCGNVMWYKTGGDCPRCARPGVISVTIYNDGQVGVAAHICTFCEPGEPFLAFKDHECGYCGKFRNLAIYRGPYLIASECLECGTVLVPAWKKTPILAPRAKPARTKEEV